MPLLLDFTGAGVHDLRTFAASALAPGSAHVTQLFARFSALEPDAIDGLASGFARGLEQHAELGQVLHDLGTPFVLNLAHEALSIEARSHRSIPSVGAIRWLFEGLVVDLVPLGEFHDALRGSVPTRIRRKDHIPAVAWATEFSHVLLRGHAQQRIEG